jgi:hypothetical protein
MRPNHGRGHGKRRRRYKHRCFASRSDLGTCAQVIYFRGTRTIAAVTDEWASSPDILVHEMAKVECRTGPTQILQSLSIARELGSTAIVLIGDAFEECPEALEVQAEQFSNAGIPMFTFLEGDDREATLAFSRLAGITGGAFAVFGDYRAISGIWSLRPRPMRPGEARRWRDCQAQRSVRS